MTYLDFHKSVKHTESCFAIKLRFLQIVSPTLNSVYFSQGRSSDEDDDDYDGLDGITFAPHDVCPINFDSKNNVHGLGYRGIDPTTALFHGKRLDPVPVKSKGRLGIRGQVIRIRHLYSATLRETGGLNSFPDLSNFPLNYQIFPRTIGFSPKLGFSP